MPDTTPHPGENDIEEPGFLDRLWQDSSILKNFVEPGRPGSRRSYDEKGWKYCHAYVGARYQLCAFLEINLKNIKATFLWPGDLDGHGQPGVVWFSLAGDWKDRGRRSAMPFIPAVGPFFNGSIVQACVRMRTKLPHAMDLQCCARKDPCAMLNFPVISLIC